MANIEDSIEQSIGSFGRYQTWILFLVLLGRCATEFQLTNVVFVLPHVDYVCNDEGVMNATNFCPCKNPEYDKSTIVSSATSEFNLTCERTSLASFAQSMLQVGILAGSIFYGYVSDKYGRKIAAVSAMFFTGFFGTIAALSPNLWLFIVCRFFIGMSVGGTMLSAYVLVIELSGKSFRPYVIGLEGIAYVISYFVQPIIAYYVREWRHLLLVTSVPWLLIISYYWLIPESPRWLITVGKKKEAIEILTFIAKKNKLTTDFIEEHIMGNEVESQNKEKRGTYLDLFRTRRMRMYTIINACIWLCCSHTFFGINQYIGRLAGNLYLNVMLSAACLTPGLFLVTIATLYLKRKVSIIATFCIAAFSLLFIIFIPANMSWAILTCAIVGQLGAYTSFILSYLYCSEIFPTLIRNSAMGFSSVFARFGSFVAPFVVNIGIQWVSMSIFSGLAFSAALLCLFLPETKDITLLNTIEQAEQESNKNHRSLDQDFVAPPTDKF
ncbi:hypothetical protein O0L34_g5509 [Tuta absoluta]|nr:hypothetical protein O0L34_g5509 [Tuta absoluta]